MDFNMKQRRDESEEDEQETSCCAKLARLNNNNNNNPSSPALPLFVPQPTTTTQLHFSSDHSTPTTRMGSYFSLAQWQELELQALIFRHLIAGAAVPPELLHLVEKSLIPSPPPYYLCNPLHYHPSLVQCGGYWGKGAGMDPEPGRCRRTDGKKWRCSRDVVVGQKYCERHMHRGRNRSRKPVENPSSATATATAPPFTLSTNHHLPRPLEETNSKYQFDAQNDGQSGGNRRLRHFFDDWPRTSVDESENAATNLSISTSDFSLKLGSNGEAREREREIGSGMATWRAAPMGGPLAEALRSSPTSVLHRLQRTSASSFVTS